MGASGRCRNPQTTCSDIVNFEIGVIQNDPVLLNCSCAGDRKTKIGMEYSVLTGSIKMFVLMPIHFPIILSIKKAVLIMSELSLGNSCFFCLSYGLLRCRCSEGVKVNISHFCKM